MEKEQKQQDSTEQSNVSYTLLAEMLVKSFNLDLSVIAVIFFLLCRQAAIGLPLYCSHATLLKIAL